MSELTERLRSKRSCTVCDGDGIKSNGKECGGCKGSGEVYRYDRTGAEAADEIDRLTRELAEARDKALEEAWQAIKAREAEYEASFEANEFKGMTLAAIAALASAAANVRALKEKP